MNIVLFDQGEVRAYKIDKIPECAILKPAEKCAAGWIDASGEERDDNWALEISRGKVMFITYEQVIKDTTVFFDAKGGRHHD